MKTSWCQQLPARALRGSSIVWERGTWERVLISAHSHWGPGSLQPNPEKRNAFITEQQTRGPLGSRRFPRCQRMGGLHKWGYVIRAVWTPVVVLACAHIHFHTICSFSSRHFTSSRNHCDINAAGSSLMRHKCTCWQTQTSLWVCGNWEGSLRYARRKRWLEIGASLECKYTTYSMHCAVFHKRSAPLSPQPVQEA